MSERLVSPWECYGKGIPGVDGLTYAIRFSNFSAEVMPRRDGQGEPFFIDLEAYA